MTMLFQSSSAVGVEEATERHTIRTSEYSIRSVGLAYNFCWARRLTVTKSL